MKAILFVSVAALGLGAWAYLPGRFRETHATEAAEVATFAARRGDLRLTVTENGYLKATKSVELKPEFRGSGTITWLIEEGETVEEGQTLVEFDATDVQNQLDETQNTLVQQERELETAKANLEIQLRDNVSAIEKAELGLEIATLTYERYEEEYLNKKRQNELAVEKAQSEYERTKEHFEQVPQLEAEGFLTSIQAEEERIRLRESEINRDNAVAEAELYEKYTRPMELKQKLAEVKSSERDLVSAREKAEINVKEKEANVSRQENLIKSSRSKIEKLKKDLAAMKIVAPQPGVVIHGDPRNPWNKENIKVGRNVYQGWTLITLPDLSEMQVLTEVHEADIDQLAEGQPVVISLDTYRDETFTGKVTKIASVATTGDWGDETNKQFRVEVTMDPTETELRAGISAEVEILVDTLGDVVHVPIQAVFKEGEDYFCFAVSDGAEPERRVVEIGRSNTHYVVIESGLDAGERVLLYDPREEGRGSLPGGGAQEEDDESAVSPTGALGDEE